VSVSGLRVAVGFCVVLALVFAAVAVAATVFVSPAEMDGWAVANGTCGAQTTGSVAFVRGPTSPPGAGGGSLEFAVGVNGDSFPTVRQSGYSGVKLSTLTALDYSTFVSHPGTGAQAPYVSLYVDINNDGIRDDVLTFEPIYQGLVALNSWQHWDALRGRWWSGAMHGPPPLFTLAGYLTAHPNAAIVNTGGGGGVILAAGCGGPAWSSFVGDAANLTVGVNGDNTTYDFGPTPPPGEAPTSSGAVSGGNQGHKQLVCHNAHTISIDQHAPPSHPSHGDTEGSC